MATVRPFRALRYAPERVDLPLVLAPPGALDEETARELHEREPRNAVRVVAGAEGPLDDAASRRAALHLAEWRRAGILVGDEHPSLYLLRQTRTDADGAERVDVGFFGLLALDVRAERDVRLAPLEERSPALVEAALAHVVTTGVQTDPALLAYADESGRIERALDAEMDEREPDVRAQAFGATCELWIVDDETTAARVARHLDEQPLTLVLGHERYEAARLVENARVSEQAAGPAEGAPVGLLAWFVKAEAGALDEDAARATLPPRGVVLAPLVAQSDLDS